MTLADVVLEEKDDLIMRPEKKITRDVQSNKFKEVFVQSLSEIEQPHVKIVQLSSS